MSRVAFEAARRHSSFLGGERSAARFPPGEGVDAGGHEEDRNYDPGVELLERHAELTTAAAHWRRARSGTGSIVLVGGEAGIGKTALVRTFVDGLDGEAAVAWGACDPLRTPRPLG